MEGEPSHMKLGIGLDYFILFKEDVQVLAMAVMTPLPYFPPLPTQIVRAMGILVIRIVQTG
jgi:hypothetical protein